MHCLSYHTSVVLHIKFMNFVWQLNKENPCGPILTAVKVEDDSKIVTKEAIKTTLRRAISFYSSLQAHDGHWPAENAGPLFFLPSLVINLLVLLRLYLFVHLIIRAKYNYMIVRC